MIFNPFLLVFPKKWSNFALVIELDRHIEILLLDNDCVIVPGFGGFVAHHVEARYDKSDNSFLPPLRSLGFNPHLKNINDSLLAQSYVEAYDISYPEAQRAIANDTERMKASLCEQGTFELRNIGTLAVNDQGDIVFEPCEAGILTPALYGLDAFVIDRLDATPRQKESAPVAETPLLEEERKPTPALPTSFIEPAAESDDDDTAYSERTISIKVSWIRNIAVAAAAIVAFFLISTPVSNSIEGKMYVSDMSTGVLTKISVLDTPNAKMTKTNVRRVEEKIRQTAAAIPAEDADTAKASHMAKGETAAKADATASKKTAMKPDTTAPRGVAYGIVLASQVTRSGADRYVEELHKEGHDKAFTYINNKVVRVIYGQYDTEEDALKALNKVRGSTHFEQAWIYKMKHAENRR